MDPKQKNITIHVFLSTGYRRKYNMPLTSSISDLINQINLDSSVEKPADKVISVIYQGKVLQETQIIRDLIIFQQDEISFHVFFRLPPPPSDEPDIDLDNLRGFDRLQRMNYTHQQIADIRLNFHQLHGTADQTPEERVAIEEEWFPTIFNQENPLDVFNVPSQDSVNLRSIPREQPHNPPIISNETDAPDTDLNLCFRFFLGIFIGLVFGISLSLILFLDSTYNIDPISVFRVILSIFFVKNVERLE